MQEKSEKERSIVEKRKKIEKGNSELNRAKWKQRKELGNEKGDRKRVKAFDIKCIRFFGKHFLMNS